jgi:hypothetical protein
MKLSHFNENYILTYLLGPAFEAKTLQSWCKNDVNSRISQTNMIDFTLLTLVDAFTLHMLLDLHIVIILHSVLYILILYIYIYIYIFLFVHGPTQCLLKCDSEVLSVTVFIFS